MLMTLSLLCLFSAVLVLIILAIIDFQTRLLPNIWVGLFAVLGIIFHTISREAVLSWEGALLGALGGFGLLYTIRLIANAHYKQDSLGLGDVKLLGAAGIWLGFQPVMIAMSVGAFAGLGHGLIYAIYLARKKQETLSLRLLKIPAGPGFVFGILVSGSMVYADHIMQHIGVFLP